MRRHAIRLIACVAGVLLAISTLAQLVFPPGSSLGLTPPSGMTPSRGFTGFQGPNNASIVMAELRGAEFARLGTEMTAAQLATRGMIERSRRDFPLPGGTGLLIEGEQRVDVAGGPITMTRWLLLVPATGMVGMVTLQLPQADATPEKRAEIERALATVVVRIEDVTARRAALPFAFTDAPGLRLVETMAGTSAVLMPPGSPFGTPEATRHPMLMIVTSVSRATIPPGTEAALADTQLRRIAGTPDLTIAPSESGTLAGHASVLLRAEGTPARGAKPLRYAQWLAVLPDGRNHGRAGAGALGQVRRDVAGVPERGGEHHTALMEALIPQFSVATLNRGVRMGPAQGQHQPREARPVSGPGSPDGFGGSRNRYRRPPQLRRSQISGSWLHRRPALRRDLHHARADYACHLAPQGQ